MDLFGTSAQAIAQGNMRTQAVRDLNEKIQEHNADVADKINGLRKQQKTSDTIADIEATGKALWTSKGMPDKIKAYQEWKAKRAQKQTNSTNPEQESNRTLQANADENAPHTQATTPEQNPTEPPAEPRAEGSPSGLSVAEEASEVTEGAGSKLSSGITGALEGSLKKGALSKLGEATGAIGGAAQAGVDLYDDFKGGHGFHLAGDNWEEKTGNALNLAGSIADVGGTFFAPLAVVGGALDLASAGFNEIGSKVEEDKQADELTQEQQRETTSQVTSAPEETIVTGRVQ
jgi:hypothetical protein